MATFVLRERGLGQLEALQTGAGQFFSTIGSLVGTGVQTWLGYEAQADKERLAAKQQQIQLMQLDQQRQALAQQARIADLQGVNFASKPGIPTAWLVGGAAALVLLIVVLARRR